MPRLYPISKIRNVGIVAHIDASFRSLKPLGFNCTSATGKPPFSRPLSRINVIEIT